MLLVHFDPFCFYGLKVNCNFSLLVKSCISHLIWFDYFYLLKDILFLISHINILFQMIDQATIDRIRDAANIVEVISDYGVTLRKRGVNYVGLCPFHNERTPSFSVSPAKELCKCFSCGKGGNVVHFVMEYENIGYYDALRVLAKKYGIEIHERELSDAEKQAQSEREGMFIVNSYARDYFQNSLRNTTEGISYGMAYFRQRGFRDDIIEKFQLGYCLDKWDAFSNEAIAKGYNRDLLVKTGLSIEREGQGNLIDRFRGRVMFPVHTLSGKVVAFGGRVLNTDAKTAKYQNSPESEIYHKSKELYGIYFAKRAIQQNDRCYLVEGYTDVIQMHQSGVENVVASSGTALTQGQIALIRRLTFNITVLYDGDSAGIKASLRGIDLLLEEGMNVKVLLLPDGDDPDSFAKKHNSKELLEYLKSHEVDFIRFKADILLHDAANDPVKKAEAIESIVKSISLISEPIKRSLYIKETSEQLGISEELLNDGVNKKIKITVETLKKQSEREKSVSPEGDEPKTQDFASSLPEQLQAKEFNDIEKLIIQMVIKYSANVLFVYDNEETGEKVEVKVADFIKSDLENDGLQFHSDLYRRVLDEAVNHINDEGFDSSRYFLSHPELEISRLATDLMSERYQLSKYHSKYQHIPTDEERLDRLIPQLMLDLKNEFICAEMKKLEQQLLNPDIASDTAKCSEIMTRYVKLKDIQKAISRELGDRVIIPKK